MADILRLVESAQGRAAPVQRLADTVAGKFALGVMGCSLATLAFWSLAGPHLFPQVLTLRQHWSEQLITSFALSVH